MPLNYGQELTARLKPVKKVLSAYRFTYQDLSRTCRKAFHFLSPENTQLLSPDFIQWAEGWNREDATYHILKLVETYVNSRQPNSQFCYDHLLASLKRALLFSQKVTYAELVCEEEVSDPDFHESSLNYYYAMMTCAFPTIKKLEDAGFKNLSFMDNPRLLEEAKKVLPDIDWTLFLQQCRYACADRNQTIPTLVYVLDLVRDMQKEIKGLKIGEQAFYPLGSIRHCVLCKVAREKDGTYSFDVYNTGDQVETYHAFLNAKQLSYGKPVCIKKLPLEALTSSRFLEKLIQLSIQSPDMHAFYRLIYSHLIIRHQGVQIEKSNRWHKLPRLGICTVACWQMLLEDELPKEEFQQLKMAKLASCLELTSKIVKATSKTQALSEIKDFPSDKEKELVLNKLSSQAVKMHKMAVEAFIDY